jgi:FMN-dependent oxidoreductase (nitrilotriacetate monooxygenase family)
MAPRGASRSDGKRADEKVHGAVKQLHLGVFDNAQSNDTGTALWRHPDNQRVNFDSLGYWTEIAGICEDARLDFLFLADAWGWADVAGTRPDVCSFEGLELPRLDPAVIVSALVPETTNLGLVITGATLVEQPYPLARRLASIDQISGGRLGWNIVTAGSADTAAAVLGVAAVKPDDRYDMADDFMEVVYKVWEGCWEPDALIKDKKGIYSDPAKIHRIDHDGPYYSSHGYGNTAATPQGTPVLFQAGSSPRGSRFGATHGECIFVSGSNVKELSGYVSAVRTEAAKAGRDPHSIKVLAGVAMVIAATHEEAERKHQEILGYQTPEITVASYAWFTGLDLSSYDPSTPMEDLHTELGQTQIARFKGQTVGEVLKAWHEHGVRGNTVVGSPEEIADELCALAEGADLDGFLINPLILPGSIVDFVEHVLPILRKRGMFREEYEEHTLRERVLGPGTARLRNDHPGARHRHWS